MIHILFTIHDNKAEACLPIFSLPNDAMALRSFADCVNDPGHQFSRHPSDYTLFKIGSFDDNGTLTPYETKMSLGNGVEFIDHGKKDAAQLGLLEQKTFLD